MRGRAPLARAAAVALAVLVIAGGLVGASSGGAAPAADGAGSPRAAPSTGTAGYALVGSTGVVSTFDGAAYLGDLYDAPPGAPVVAAAPTTDGHGYWLAGSDGGVFAFGDARYRGSMGGHPLAQPIVGMAAGRGGGYWLVARDGGIFAFDAPFLGSMGGHPLAEPVVGMAADPATGGYWLVARDGGIFAFDAPFLGSMGGHPLAEPVVGMAPTADGHGYWLVAADGGVFTFGDARFEGSTGGHPLASPITALLPSGDGAGYRLVARDGGVFAFGDATYEGSAADPLHPPLYPPEMSEQPPPIVAALAVGRGPERALGGPVRVTLAGDSLAYETAFGMAHVSDAYGAEVQNAAMAGCGITVPEADALHQWSGSAATLWPACQQWAQRLSASLAASHPDVVALLAGYWECQQWREGSTWLDLSDPTYAAQVEAELQAFTRLVRAVGAQPVFLTAPYFDDGTPDALVDRYNAIVAQVARDDGDPVLDAGSVLDPGGRYAPVVDGTTVRVSDGVHLTFAATSEVLAAALLPTLVAEGRAARL